jgi:Pyruvate/2-oxoacid:ferredoxin oxidoreductase delta subunit
MGHQTSKSYLKLQERLDRSTQGAPASDTLFRILEVIFSDEEAELVSKLPLVPFSTEVASKLWNMDEKGAFAVLDTLADKGILFDSDMNGIHQYMLAPTMAGFFEFSLMRTDGKFDRKVLSELYYEYINVEEEFLHQVLAITPPIERVFVHEDLVRQDNELVILDYERATKVIETASCITVGTCYCRHKAEHVGRSCDNPQDVCLTFNGAARTLSRHGIAREITKKEAMDILKRVRELGLVQIGDNVQTGVNWICNCCSCCCEAIQGYKRLGYMPKVNSDFKPEMDLVKCTGCGMCVKRCPVDAIILKNDKAIVDVDVCFGCGVCSRFCPTESVDMVRRDITRFIPKDSMERIVLNAIESGKLQNFLFNDQELWTYGAMRRFIGIMLKLPPAKWALANRQLRSRFLTSYARRMYQKNPSLFGNIEPDYSHPELRSSPR